MSEDAIVHRADEGGGNRPPEPRRATDEQGGFFRIYKRGQGYWTRMGTAAAAALIGALSANFLYHHLPVWLGAMGVAQTQTKPIAIYVITALLAAYGLLVFWLMNKPANADFLIATDSEMKKVNWTSRRELIGSTKVVIVFMFLIAFLLFEFDLIFGEAFYGLGVLYSRPLPSSDAGRWWRWGFWAFVCLQAAGLLFVYLKNRSNER